MISLAYFVVGCFGGFLAGLLGVGGGLIFIPFIEAYLKQHPMVAEESVKYVLANSIAIVFASGVSGIFRQKKQGNWDWKGSLNIGIPGAIASFGMSYLIENGNWYSKSSFQTIFLSFLILSIYNMLFSKKGQITDQTNENPFQPQWKKWLIGIIAGTTVSLSGLGGGVIMVPLFRMALKMPMKKATALSLSIVPILALASLLKYATSTPHSLINQGIIEWINHDQYWTMPNHLGYILFPIVIPMMTGTMITTSYAQKKVNSIPVLWLRIIFALISITIFFKTIFELLK